MPTILSENDVRDMIVYIAERIIASKPLLTEIDSQIGDGDHGIGMAGGMQKAKDAVTSAKNSGNVYALFERAGRAMLMSMGGASGVLFGSLYLTGAKDMAPNPELDAGGLAMMLERSLIAIQERGKAQPGDKTMVDALHPAVQAMRQSKEKGLLAMLQAAEEAALSGVEATKEQLAKFGRAKSLMERAVGHQDAGATSVWIILRAMCTYVAEKENS